MGRLAGRGQPSRLGRAQSRLRGAPVTEAERSRQRDDAAPWRAWYRSARWRALRLEVLRRAGWQCEQTGVMLVGKHPAPNSPVIDHIKPHRGDPERFWDSDNLQAVAKEWHDGEKQRQERAAGL